MFLADTRRVITGNYFQPRLIYGLASPNQPATGAEMSSQICEPKGVCPIAKCPIVFRDGDGRWRGRFGDGSAESNVVVLPSPNGEHAQQLLANYLGVAPQRIRIFEASGRMY